MMKYNYFLGVIKYIPDIERHEIINIGIVLHNPKLKFLKSTFIENYSRLAKFDDELDLEFFKLYTESIKDEFSNNLFKTEEELQDSDLIKKLSKNYINQFYFDIKPVFQQGDPNNVFDYYSKLMLHFDYPKNKRLTKESTNQLVKNYFSLNNIEFEVVNSKKIEGKFNDLIKVDFKIGDKYIKIFDINEKNYKFYLDQIKTWAFNAIALKDIQQNITFIFIDSVNNKVTNTYKNLLKTYSETYSLDDPEILSEFSNMNNYLSNFGQN